MTFVSVPLTGEVGDLRVLSRKNHICCGHKVRNQGKGCWRQVVRREGDEMNLAA